MFSTQRPAQPVNSFLADPRRPCDVIVHPAAGQLAGQVTAQPSKNYTSRYLLAAGLAAGESTVRNCAASDDAEAMKRGLDAFGAKVSFNSSGIAAPSSSGEDISILGVAGRPVLANATESVNVGNAGAVLRLLLGIGSLLPEVTFVTDHLHSLGKRPNADLLKSLSQLGCASEPASGLLPITLRGGSLRGGRVAISGARSSQFLSSLLFLAPLVGEPVEIEVVDGLVSKAPVRQTLEVLAAAGIHIEASDNLLHFKVSPQQYRADEYRVNGDWPGSAALLTAAAVMGSSIEIRGLYDDQQGEKAAAEVLTQMGFPVTRSASSGGSEVGAPFVRTEGRTSSLKAVEFDGDLATDAVLALIGGACFAEGRSRFFNVSNLRLKECDRITEPLNELRKLGVRCWEGKELGDKDPDAILIEGNPSGYEGGIEVDGRSDHRVIMLLATVALGCSKPVRITGAHHVAKSYPMFFSHMTSLGANVQLVESPL